MTPNDPRHWAAFEIFDPMDGTVIRRPPGEGKGYWVGAPGAAYDPEEETFYLTYRVRRPRGVEPDRGGELFLAASRDGVQFDTIWGVTKAELDSKSIERCALGRASDGGWLLYISYVDPADERWRTDVVAAEQPEAFDVRTRRPVLSAEGTGTEGVKDPFVFQVAGLHHMLVSYATSAGSSSPDELHGTADAYNTGLIRSATGLATSEDGLQWQWEGEVFGPRPDGWDRYCSRIGCIWRESGVWLALYDGSAEVSENYEERVGLAYSFDLRTFHRVTRSAPLMTTPASGGALRYFDVVTLPDATFFYYEMALPDGSHELRIYRR